MKKTKYETIYLLFKEYPFSLFNEIWGKRLIYNKGEEWLTLTTIISKRATEMDRIHGSAQYQTHHKQGGRNMKPKSSSLKDSIDMLGQRIRVLKNYRNKMTPTQMAEILSCYPGGLEFLLHDFFKDLERKRKEAKKQNRATPIIIRDLNDLVGTVQLLVFMANHLEETEPIEKNTLAGFLEKNPDALILVDKILKHQMARSVPG